MKRIAIAALVCAALFPAPAGATHCREIWVYSGFRVAQVSFSYDALGDWGCAGGGDTNLDYILPGASYLQVFVRSLVAPDPGRIEDDKVIGSFLTFDGADHPITWTRGQTANGTPNNIYFSQDINIAQSASVAPGARATATVCVSEDCDGRVYRTATTT